MNLQMDDQRIRVFETRGGKLAMITWSALAFNAVAQTIIGGQRQQLVFAAILLLGTLAIWRHLLNGVNVTASEVVIRRSFSTEVVPLETFRDFEFKDLGYRGHRLVIVTNDGVRIPTELIFAQPTLEPKLTSRLVTIER